MGYHLRAEKLNSEIKTFLEKDRLPERRIWPKSNCLHVSREVGGTAELHELYKKAQQLDPWPGDRWQEPIGSHRNPFLRQSKNLVLASIILTDPTRQQEAFDKLLEAGYKPKDAISVLEKYHENVEVTESP